MNKLGTYQQVEASTYIPVIGSLSSLMITGLAVKTMWNDRNHDTKTLSGSEHAKLALYNIVNIASLGLVGTSFGVVKLVACFFSSLANCCSAKQSDVESKKSESTEAKDLSFLTPKKGTSKKDALSKAKVVEMLSPEPSNEKPVKDANELSAFAGIFRYINSSTKKLEEIQEELDQIVNESTAKRIDDLGVQLKHIKDAYHVLPILEQKVVSKFEIYPCRESGWIANIILSRFPELESQFSECALQNWENPDFEESGTELERAINEGIFREVQSIVDKAKSADDVRFVLKQYMLHSLKQTEIKEIKRAADVILAKFPGLVGHFSEKIQKSYREAALASSESCVTPKKLEAKESDLAPILSPQTTEGYTVIEVHEIDFLALLMNISSLGREKEETEQILTDNLDKAIERRLRQLPEQIDVMSSGEEVLPILEQSYMTGLKIYPLVGSFRAAKIVITKFPDLASRFFEDARQGYKEAVFPDPKDLKEEINKEILDQLKLVVAEGDENAVIAFLKENRFLVSALEVRQIKDINRAARIILDKFGGLVGYFSSQIQRDYTNKMNVFARGESKEAATAEEKTAVDPQEIKRKLIASLPKDPMANLKKRVEV